MIETNEKSQTKATNIISSIALHVDAKEFFEKIGPQEVEVMESTMQKCVVAHEEKVKHLNSEIEAAKESLNTRSITFRDLNDFLRCRLRDGYGLPDNSRSLDVAKGRLIDRINALLADQLSRRTPRADLTKSLGWCAGMYAVNKMTSSSNLYQAYGNLSLYKDYLLSLGVNIKDDACILEGCF